MSATATITTKTKNNVVAVPLQAIVEKAPPSPSPGPTVASSAPPVTGEKPKELKGVYVMDKSNKVRFVSRSQPVSPASLISRLRRASRPAPRLLPGPVGCSRL
jgi:HlyD family secretion protein